jgi:hypothetical protein
VPSRAARIFVLAALAAGLVWPQTAVQDTFTGVERVVAIGDVHADFDRLAAVLRQAGLTDNRNRWSGGRTHLVLCGDLVDRGPASGRVLDLVMTLEQQAQRAGGRVHALIGNHEAMAMFGDLRYVSPEDYASFRNRDSEKLREAAAEAFLAQMQTNGTAPADPEAWKKQFIAEHPLGWVERAQAFLPEGKYGKWLRGRNAIVKINDALFLHGGLSDKYADMPLTGINNQIRAELANAAAGAGPVAADELGPLWFRGLMQEPEDDPATRMLVERILERHGVRHIVVGHTPQAAVMPRFGGRVIGVDVALARVMGGQPAFLLIDKDGYAAVHQGRRLKLPLDGESVAAYLEAAAALDPPDSRLRQQLQGKQ